MSSISESGAFFLSNILDNPRPKVDGLLWDENLKELTVVSRQQTAVSDPKLPRGPKK